MNQPSSACGSTLGLLGVVFITLKLCHVIEWSWVWVTAPFWGGLVFVVIIVLAALLMALIFEVTSLFKK